MVSDMGKEALLSVAKGLIAAAAATLPGIALIALAAVYLNPGDGAILAFNQMLKLAAIFAGAWTAVGPGGTRGFVKGAVVGILYIALGYGICAVWDEIFVSGPMLAMEFFMGLLLGGVAGALVANLPVKKRKRKLA